MGYDERVVAFIDILGFQKFVESTIDAAGQDRAEKISKLESAFHVIDTIRGNEAREAGLSKNKNSSREVSNFSDTVVFTFLYDEPSEVFHTLVDIQLLIIQLILAGLSCRGAITLGKAIHNEKMLFGPAVIEAYKLESASAFYPRVILDREIIDLGANQRSVVNSSSEEQEYIEMLLQRDSDGMYFIDYFGGTRDALSEDENGFENYISTLGDFIRKGLMGSSHVSKASLRTKYYWMRERYNQMIRDLKPRDVARDLEKNGEFELAAFYRKLKEIGQSRKI